MIKTLGFFLLWLVGSAAAVAVAWTGVSIVDDGLINPAPANNQIAVSEPLSTAATSSSESPAPTSSLRSTPAVDPTATSTPRSNGATPPETPADAPATPAPQASVAATEAPTTGPSPSAEPAPTTAATAAPTPTTTAPTTTAPTTTAPTSVPPTPTTAAAKTLTFNLVGGSTAISFSPTGVVVLWATPNPGFTVEIEPKSDGTRVDFEADHHESRIDAWWSGGPRHEIREDADD